MEILNIDFKGYRLDADVRTLSMTPGIYVVYRCLYDSINNIVDIKDLLYIGQTYNLREGLTNHEKKSRWLKECSQKESLCYAYAKVEKEKLDRVENGLIFMQKPRMNEILKDSYIYDTPVGFKITGNSDLFMQKNFKIVQKNTKE